MDTFYQVFGFVAALCAGIIIMTVFFTAVGYLKRVTRGFEIVKLKGIVKEGSLINLHLKSGKSFLGVRFVGFTDLSTIKGAPYQLSNMIVLETAKGTRLLVQANSLNVIEEVDSTA